MVDAPTAPRWHSTTSHLVRREGDSWIKQARDNSPLAQDQIGREHAALTLIGVPHAYDPATATLITPHLGEPVGEWTRADVDAALAWHARFPDATDAGLLPAQYWTGVAQQTVTARRGGHARAWWDDLVDAALDVDLTVLAGDRLIHSDPNPRNWLRDPDGCLWPIDWENGMAGHPDMNAAFLATLLALDRFTDPARHVLHVARPHPEVLRLVHRVKSALSIS